MTKYHNNWLQKKPSIQIASKVRATLDLMIHIIWRIAPELRFLYEKFNLNA